MHGIADRAWWCVGWLFRLATVRELLDVHTLLVTAVETLLPGAIEHPAATGAGIGDASGILFWSYLSLVRESHGLFSVVKHLTGKIAGACQSRPSTHPNALNLT